MSVFPDRGESSRVVVEQFQQSVDSSATHGSESKRWKHGLLAIVGQTDHEQDSDVPNPGLHPLHHGHSEFRCFRESYWTVEISRAEAHWDVTGFRGSYFFEINNE